MPSRDPHNEHAKSRQQEAVGQHRLLVAVESMTPIRPEQGEKGHGDDEVCPCRSARPDARNQQQLCRAREAREHPEQEAGSGGPEGGASPERISGPPVEQIGAQNAEGESHRESDAHGVDRVAEDGNPRLRLVEARPLADRVDQVAFFRVGAFRRHVASLCKPVSAVITLLALTGCEGTLSVVNPAGPAARIVATLWWVMLSGAAVIFALVMVLLFLPFLRRAKGGDNVRHVRVWIIGLGLVFPMAVLAALLAYGLVVGERLLPRADNNVVSVGAEGRRWTWTFTYEDAPERTTEAVLHIPAGQPVDVAITTADVIHSFWVPRLAGKLDAIPGHVNVLRIEADEPGTYRGVSAEFSGADYARFTFAVIAHDASEWEAFLRGELE
jgi:cytochrome c oxidase subunit II